MTLWAGAAQAQTKYYIRERIVGLPVSTATTPATPPATPAAGTWTYGTYGAYSSSCSNAATRSRTATCTANGQTVADSQCTETKMTSESKSISTGCTSLIVNGTFETNSIAPWTGGMTFGGSPNYGADASRFIMGIGSGSTGSVTVTGLDAGQSYVLRFSCRDHNSNSSQNSVTKAGSTTATIACGGGGWLAKTLPFTATSTSATISFAGTASSFLDIDSVSITLN